MNLFKSVEITNSGKSINLKRTDGSSIRYHATWLRDNALDPKTRDSINGQRLITISDIPVSTYIKSATLDEKGEKISINFLPERKEIVFSVTWLEKNAYDIEHNKKKGWISKDLKTWGNDISKNIPTLDYKTAKLDKKLLHEWLKSIHCYGFAKMTGGKRESGAIKQIADLIGYIRETNYGKWFEVRSKVDAINLAYTNLGLELHTDNPYRNPVPTIQILYCIENSVEGGESTVVDGFHAISLLKEKNPGYFNLLSKYNVVFEFKDNSQTHLKSNHPIIELSVNGELKSIRFNNRSAAPMTDIPYDDMENYYNAYRLLAEIINDKSLSVKFKLNPGECFVVDNSRVLHARTSYSSSGSRWLQGCYVDKDELLSKILIHQKDN